MKQMMDMGDETPIEDEGGEEMDMDTDVDIDTQTDDAEVEDTTELDVTDLSK